MILVFASSKGGVGKSTTCAACGAALALENSRVLILDLDQNRTLHRWSRKFSIPGLTVEAPAPDDFPTVLKSRLTSGDYDHVLIDLAGVREMTMFKAISRADLVIIPAQASEPDIREALVIAGDVRDLEETAGRKIPYRLLLTKMFPLRNRVSDFAYSELARKGLPMFKTVLVERTAYREMFLNGEPPTQHDTGKGAGVEIAALLDEIEEIVYPDAAPADRHPLQAAE
ncbi:MAG: ParA family protein [Hyphomicrobium sp.]|jgi:chromosome partitioning protein|uniref:ParA family protein n=1 Tax=Hyphomicrobium sp. TaxID=82 RepID=UPI0025C12021|nr:ParA family protein [Hyphomicrobium sp.]MBX9865134.1 ParA family protein [Hyphomicrobium sp.]